mmetsp:Transcript_19112/g.29894  ORF Transcript_19112/g.29894 Transcript_19112/m.29894 type:complete len:208 (+) Transcript_19112:188-811(+)
MSAIKTEFQQSKEDLQTSSDVVRKTVMAIEERNLQVETATRKTQKRVDVLETIAATKNIMSKEEEANEALRRRYAYSFDFTKVGEVRRTSSARELTGHQSPPRQQTPPRSARSNPSASSDTSVPPGERRLGRPQSARVLLPASDSALEARGAGTGVKAQMTNMRQRLLQGLDDSSGGAYPTPNYNPSTKKGPVSLLIPRRGDMHGPK